jgi:hypothetical protein
MNAIAVGGVACWSVCACLVALGCADSKATRTVEVAGGDAAAPGASAPLDSGTTLDAGASAPLDSGTTLDAGASAPLDSGTTLDAGASFADTAAETASSGAQPCDDGTGATDCCPVGAKDLTACANPGLSCWTRCRFASPDSGQGVRSQLECISGSWLAGHGLFPCRRDAGP